MSPRSKVLLVIPSLFTVVIACGPAPAPQSPPAEHGLAECCTKLHEMNSRLGASLVEEVIRTPEEARALNEAIQLSGAAAATCDAEVAAGTELPAARLKIKQAVGTIDVRAEAPICGF